MYELLYMSSFNLERNTILKYISAFLTVCAYLVTHQINVSSKHFVTAFDIKDFNIGIYVDKLISFRTLLMIIGSLIQYIAQRYIKILNFMEYSTLISLCLMTVSRVIFLIFLYMPSSLSLQAYLILNIESLYSGYFQMSILTTFPEYSSITTLCIFCLSMAVYLLQMSIECLPYSNPLLIIKTQFWFCVLISILGIGLWVFYLFYINKILPPEFQEIRDEEFYLNVDLLTYFQNLQYYVDEKVYNELDNIHKKLQNINIILPKIKKSHSEMKLIMNMNLSKNVLEKERSNRENILEDYSYVNKKINKIKDLINELNKIDTERIKEIKKIIKNVQNKIAELENATSLDVKKDGTFYKLQLNMIGDLESQKLKKLEEDSCTEKTKELKILKESTEKLIDIEIVLIVLSLVSDVSRIRDFASEIGRITLSSVDEIQKQQKSDMYYFIGNLQRTSSDLSESFKTIEQINELLKRIKDEETFKKIKLESFLLNIKELDDKTKELLEIFEKYLYSDVESPMIKDKNTILSLLLQIESIINKHLPEVNSIKECKTALTNYLVKRTNDLTSKINKWQFELYKLLKIRTNPKNINQLSLKITDSLDKGEKNEKEKVKEIVKVFGEIEVKIEHIIKKEPSLENFQNIGLFEELIKTLSPFMMGIGASAIKNFIFPSLLPYAVLDKNDCHFVNLIAPLSLVLGSTTIFTIDMFVEEFREWPWYCNLIWLLIIPQLGIWMSTILAIHTKEGLFKLLVNSTSTVLFLTMALLYFYSVMESTSYVAVANHVFYKSSSVMDSLSILTLHNILTIFSNYIFLKFSVGYNATRVGLGIIYPTYRPIHSRNYNFCYWIMETLRNTFSDILLDFRLNIRDYT